MSDLDLECPRCKRLADQGAQEQQDPQQQTPADADHSFQQIAEYVDQARAQGLGDDAIRHQLLQAGWSAEAVDSGLSAPREDAFSPDHQPSRNTPWANAALILGLLALCTAGLTGPFAIWAGLKSSRNRENSSMTTAGVVLGAVGCLLFAFTVIRHIVSVEETKRAEVERAQRQEETARLEQQRRRAAQQQRQRAATQAEQQRGQQMSRNTFAYLDSLQSPSKGARHRTDAERKASWDQMFAGQWIRWEGEVFEVSGRGAVCTVSLRCGPTTMTSDTCFELDSATALSLRKGDKLRIEGQLQDHGMTGYRLKNVRVVANFGQCQ